MSFIRIYDCNATDTDFSTNGIAVLNNARNVVEKMEINGARTLSFELSKCEKTKYVMCENIAVLDGRRYRIKTVNGESVMATAIYNDAAYTHIQFLPDMIGCTPAYIMTQIFSGTPVHIMSEDETAGLGMEWVTDPTDFFKCGKLTPIGALKTLMETLDKYKIHSELYVDNYSVALVRQIGRKRNVKIDLDHNAKKVTPVRDTSEIITKLYPYGKDDLHIGTVNNGNQYITSPNYEKWKREGYMEFTEIEDPQTLMQAAMSQFDENNPKRIDIPKYSVTVDYVERPGGEIGLGDTVTVVDREFGLTTEQRVTAVELHPFERHKNTLTLGTPPRSIDDVFNSIIDNSAKQTVNTTDRGEVKTSWLEMMQKNENVSINSALQNEDIALYKTGSLYESPDGHAAVAIIKGRIALANSKDADGAWNWTTVMDGGKVIVNQVFTGALYTDLVRVMSKDGTLKIEDNLITMYDEYETLRFEAGYDPDYGLHGQYIFALYNDDGEKTAYLDSGGNLTIRGVFKTGEDREPRIVIDGNGIQGYNSIGYHHGISCVHNDNNGEISVMLNGRRAFTVRVYESNGTIITRLFSRDDDGILENVNGATYPIGKWDFSNAVVSGM